MTGYHTTWKFPTIYSNITHNTWEFPTIYSNITHNNLQLVGTEDSTTVSITLSRHSKCTVSYGGKNYKPGNTFSLSLNR